MRILDRAFWKISVPNVSRSLESMTYLHDGVLPTSIYHDNKWKDLTEVYPTATTGWLDSWISWGISQPWQGEVDIEAWWNEGHGWWTVACLPAGGVRWNTRTTEPGPAHPLAWISSPMPMQTLLAPQWLNFSSLGLAEGSSGHSQKQKGVQMISWTCTCFNTGSLDFCRRWTICMNPYQHIYTFTKGNTMKERSKQTALRKWETENKQLTYEWLTTRPNV